MSDELLVRFKAKVASHVLRQIVVDIFDVMQYSASPTTAFMNAVYRGSLTGRAAPPDGLPKNDLLSQLFYYVFEAGLKYSPDKHQLTELTLLAELDNNHDGYWRHGWHILTDYTPEQNAECMMEMLDIVMTPLLDCNTDVAELSVLLKGCLVCVAFDRWDNLMEHEEDHKDVVLRLRSKAVNLVTKATEIFG